MRSQTISRVSHAFRLLNPLRNQTANKLGIRFYFTEPMKVFTNFHPPRLVKKEYIVYERVKMEQVSIHKQLDIDGVNVYAPLFRNLRPNRLANECTNENAEVFLSSSDSSISVWEIDNNDIEQCDEFDKLKDQIQTSLAYDTDTLYVQEGSLGSFHESNVSVRVTTDSPYVAFLSSSLLVPCPNRKEAMPVQINVFAFAQFLKPQVVTHFENNTEKNLVGKVLIAGPLSPASFKKALEICGTNLLLLQNKPASETFTFPLHSNILYNGTTSVLILGSTTPLYLDQALKSFTYGSDYNVVQSNGISSFWSEYKQPLPQNANDFMDTSTVTQSPDNIVQAPKHVFILTDDNSKIPSIDEVVNYIDPVDLNKSFSFSTDQKKEICLKLFRQLNPQIQVFNKNDKDINAKLLRAFQSIA